MKDFCIYSIKLGTGKCPGGKVVGDNLLVKEGKLEAGSGWAHGVRRQRDSGSGWIKLGEGASPLDTCPTGKTQITIFLKEGLSR